jgi:predicted aspartyl protease
MVRSGVRQLSRFTVEFEVSNLMDVYLAENGYLDRSQVRRVRLRGLVDSGASRLVLPQKVVESLGLKPSGTVKVRYADGRRVVRPNVPDIQVDLQGRRSVFDATVEPKRKTAFIGALVLEALDFLVDSGHERLVPRDPKRIIAEEE